MMRNLTSATLGAAALILICVWSPGRAAGAEPDLLVKSFLEATDPAAQKAALAAIRAASPEPLAVERALRRGACIEATSRRAGKCSSRPVPTARSGPITSMCPKAMTRPASIRRSRCCTEVSIGKACSRAQVGRVARGAG